MSRHEDGNAAVDTIAAEHGITYGDLRPWASDHLAQQHAEWGWTGGDIGSSDVSCHLSSLGLYEPELVRAEAARLAERNALVDRIAANSGRSREETLAGLQALFAPAD